MTHSTESDATFRVRSFTDLRRFAADAADGDAFLVSRRRLFRDSREQAKKVYAIVRGPQAAA